MGKKMAKETAEQRAFRDFVRAARAVERRRAAEMHADGFYPPSFQSCLNAEKKSKRPPARITGGLQLKK